MSKNPNAPIQVRAAQPTDQTTVVAFNVALAFGTEGRTLERHILSRGVEAALADPSRLRYWLAEVDGEVVGMAAVSREWSDWRNSWFWWLQSVYVIPEWRRKGVFRNLLIAIRTEAMQKTGDVCGLRLYVEADNERAQLAYRALGFKPAGYRVYEDMWGGS